MMKSKQKGKAEIRSLLNIIELNRLQQVTTIILLTVGVQGMRPSILLRDSQIIQDIMDYIEKTDHFKLE